jgi:error-prone DNA polymerase
MAGGIDDGREGSPVIPRPAPRTSHPAYVELRAHTAFSFGDGTVTPEGLLRRARRLGYTHIGITDTADLGGLARFGEAAMLPMRDAGCADAAQHDALGADPCPRCERVVFPIVGAELNVDGKPAAFLARDATGYCNLAALVTAARVGQWEQWDKAVQHKHRGRPRVTWAQVAAHNAGLHALTGPASGPLASLVRAGDDAGARKLLRDWRDAFGAERLAVEVQLHHTGGAEAALAGALIELAEGEGVPWVVTNDPRYVDRAGRLVHDMLTALRHELDVDQAAARGLLHPNGEWTLLAPAEVERRWRGREEGLHESERIARECEGFELAWMRPPLPDFGVPGHGRDTVEHLRERTYEGARERWGDALGHEQRAQLEKEIEMIGRLGFAGFFLVMWDAVRFARQRGILCQGRGSAANSAVAFCLGITAVDPVKQGLLFERFISEVRMGGKTEAPDIDVDFEHDRREEVLDYMYERYKRPHAAITAVTQTYRAPNAVQDAMRALGYPTELAFTFSKRVHQAEPAEGAQLIRETLAEKHGLDVDCPRGRALLAGIAGFEGLPRLRSTHVGGFVLSAEPLGNYLPIEQTAMGRTIVQFDKDDLDAIGVPKFDFLGLGALSMVRRSFDIIEQRTGRRPQLYALPQDDAKTYDLIRRGETIGTFQIESRAQIASILHTHPERLYDLVVQVALIRPGPIQARFVHPYTQRRLGLEPVHYVHPALEPILKRTQGIPIFQEQAMAIAMALGGYSGSGADALRRTMGNIRKKERLLGELEKLRAAMAKHGVAPEIAKSICDDLVSFANYGFPESHAWSFALIAYATAYLKAHHPTEFFAGLLNSLPMGFYPVSTLIHDARRHGVEVLGPCLATGDWECTVETIADCGLRTQTLATPSVALRTRTARNSQPERLLVRSPQSAIALRIGWQLVNGIADKVVDALKAARAESPFASVADVVRRGRLNRGDALALARAGAFSAWAPDRRHAAWEALRATGDVLPLAPASDALHNPAPLERERRILIDYHAMGLSLEGHPMELVRERLRRGGAIDSRDLERLEDGRTIAIGGLVTVRQRPETAGGTIFLLLEDEYGFINVVVSKKLVDANTEVVKHATFILVQGRLEKDGAVINVVGRRFRAIDLGEKVAYRSRDFH